MYHHETAVNLHELAIANDSTCKQLKEILEGHFHKKHGFIRREGCVIICSQCSLCTTDLI